MDVFKVQKICTSKAHNRFYLVCIVNHFPLLYIWTKLGQLAPVSGLYAELMNVARIILWNRTQGRRSSLLSILPLMVLQGKFLSQSNKHFSHRAPLSEASVKLLTARLKLQTRLIWTICVVYFLSIKVLYSYNLP